jgi:hypothetical protein
VVIGVFLSLVPVDIRPVEERFAERTCRPLTSLFQATYVLTRAARGVPRTDAATG